MRPSSGASRLLLWAALAILFLLLFLFLRPDAAGMRGEGGGARADPVAPPAAPCADRGCVRAVVDAAVARGRSGDYMGAHALLERARVEGGALHDASLEAEIYLRSSAPVMRISGLEDALALVDSALVRLDRADRAGQAWASCQKGSLFAQARDLRALGAAREGVARLGVQVVEAGGLVDPGAFLAELRKESEGGGEASALPDHELPWLLGYCVFTLGQAFSLQPRIHGDSARVFLEAAAELQWSMGLGFGRAASLQWLGALERMRGAYRASLDAFEAAILEAEESGNGSALAWAHLGRALLLHDLGDRATGRAGLEVAHAMMVATGDRMGVARTSRARAEIALLDGRLEEGVALLDEATEVLLELGAVGAEVARVPFLLWAARLGRDTTAVIARANELLEAAEWGQRRIAGSVPVADALGAYLTVGALEHAAAVAALDRLSAQAAPVEQFAWAARMAEFHARTGDLRGAESRMEAALGWLAELRNELYGEDLRAGALALGITDFADPDLGLARVIGALAEGGREEVAFAFASELRARDLEAHRIRSLALAPLPIAPGDGAARTTPRVAGAGAAEVQTALSPDEALLLYVTGRGDEPTTLFALTRDELRSYPLAPLDDLEPRILRLGSALAAGDGAPELRARLGAELLAPALAELPGGVRSLLLVPDQGLHSVPFDALLPGDAEGPVLVERFATALVPSPGILVELRTTPEPPAARGVFALSRGLPVKSWDGTVLPRLRWVDREARSVARVVPGSVRRSGREATAGALLDAASGGWAVLHVAAHARVDPDLPARSALYLAPGGGHDGVLGLAELEGRSLPFHLVVLSACATSGGREDRGEGLRGPARAFLEAGARSVVATAWPVGDRVAARQMEAFYAELAAGAPVDEALAGMKRLEIAAGAPPSEWAVFQLLGEPRTRLPGGGR